MKKIISTLMIFVMIFVLAGCKKDPELLFESTNLELIVGQELTLNPTINNAEGAQVLYTSSDTSVVTANAGVVKGVKEGSAKITAELKSEGEVLVTVELSVTVNKVAVSSVEVSGNLEIRRGETTQLTATFTPTDVTYKDITWKSSDEKIATVDETGKVTGVGLGKVNITATVDGVEKSVVVTVSNPLVSSIEIEGKESLPLGEEQTLVATVNPYDANQEVEWVSSDETVATIDAEGKVATLKEGTVTFTAKATDGSNIEATFELTVTAPLPESVEVTASATELKVKETLQLTATVLPESADKTLTWASSDSKVATVDATGLVTALLGGTVTITATTSNGKTSSVEITVIDLYKEVVYVDATYEDGATFTDNGNEYIVGVNAFNNIKDAVAAVTTGGKVVVKAGEYADSFTISKKLTLEGTNAGVKPIASKVDETKLGNVSKITGTITVVSAVGVVIDGIVLKGAGKIETSSAGLVSELTIKNVIAYGKEATSTWAESGSNYETNAVINLIGVSNDSLSGPFTVKDCLFDVREGAIKVGRIKDVLIEGCVFYNNERDFVRINGGINGGYVKVLNCTFANDELGGYNGIYFASYSGGSDIQMVIEGNKFKNIGQAELNYSGAISARTYQESGAIFEFKNNTFETCYDYIRIRNNGAAEDSWSLTATGNTFIGEPVGVYYSCFGHNANDTETTNPYLAVFNNNTFKDASGKVITPDPEKLVGLKTTE